VHLIRQKWSLARALLALLLLGIIGVCGYYLGRGFWADYHYRAAEHALARSEFDAARAHLHRSETVRPNHPDLLFLLARTERRAGNYAEAVDLLRRSEQRGGVPESIDLERVLLGVEQGDLAQETLLWAYVEKGHPETNAILEALAKGYLLTFRLGRARETADQWLRREPDDPQAWLVRGTAVYHLHSYQEASEDLRRAVELMPENDSVRQRYADGLLENAQPTEALAQYDHLVKRRPEDPAAQLGRARALAALGEADQAADLLDPLLARTPRDPGALLLRGKVELLRLHPAQAEPWLRRAVEFAPFDREAVHSLAQCLQQLRRPDDARPWHERLKRIEADQRRLSALTKKVLAEPHDAGLRCEAGEIFLGIGNDTEGLRWLDSALREDPNHAPTHRILRDYYRQHNRPDLAQGHEQALANR
jgi:Flp pilus assembly protein TadD